MHIENTDVSAQRPWPTDTYIQGGNNGVVLTSDGGSYRTAFVEAFVAGTFLRGEGPTIAEAEDACWRQYERLNACPAAPAHGPFERRQYTNGSGFCTGCGTWFPRVLPELPPAGPRHCSNVPSPATRPPSPKSSTTSRKAPTVARTDVPVWLLDVDGVLNCTRPNWGERPWEAVVHVDGVPYKLRWSRKLIKRMLALYDAGKVEIRWCTTWCPIAELVEKPMRLPAFQRAFLSCLPGRKWDDVKLEAARDVLAAGRRLVWTDDTSIPTGDSDLDAAAQAGQALLISPKSRTGLTPDQMDAIERFVKARP